MGPKAEFNGNGDEQPERVTDQIPDIRKRIDIVLRGREGRKKEGRGKEERVSVNEKRKRRRNEDETRLFAD